MLKFWVELICDAPYVYRFPNKNCTSEYADCYGVDLNRNFDFQWDHNDNHRDLLDMNSEAYHGDNPFSEKESKAISQFILKHKSHIKAYVSVHSFGQFILTPWGYTKTKPKNFPKLFKIITKVRVKPEIWHTQRAHS